MEKSKRMINKEGRFGWNLAEKTMTHQDKYSLQLREAINYAMSPRDFFRPAIVSFCCQALGGASKDTIPCGASLVLLGKAIGIHDDIIDNLKNRKKRQTVFGRFGKEIALILSDVLSFKGFTLMRKSVEIGISREKIARILNTIDQIWSEQAESEILELGSRRKIDISPEECLEKIRMRASEMETIARVGGILANGSEKEIRNIGRYGRLLGTASLLRDELIDMLEVDALRHRIRYESLPLPMLFSLADVDLRAKIAAMIAQKKPTNASLWEIFRISNDTGAINKVGEIIEKVVAEGSLCLHSLKDKTQELSLLLHSLLIEQKDWRLIASF